jgi:hypothetical protein
MSMTLLEKSKSSAIVDAGQEPNKLSAISSSINFKGAE